MILRERSATKGSWAWTLNVAELTSWGTILLLLLVVHLDVLPRPVYLRALGLVTVAGVWVFALFRVLLPRARERRWSAALSVAGSLALSLAVFALLRAEVPSIQLVLMPVVAIAGLLSGPREGVGVAVAAIAGYWIVAAIGGLPLIGTAVLNSAVFLLSGLVAGLLARELRLHFQGEREEHRLATAVRHRLLAVLDAVDEAIVFRDRQGSVRVINRRAGALFDIDPDDFLGLPGAELLRTIARRTEDPEGFMETFQEVRDEPERELRVEIEQILPQRRQLKLFSGPTFDEGGVLVGRIDVYSDISEGVRRAAEIEQLYEQARNTAESYQRSLLPDSMPTLPRMSLVARYIPAAGRKAVCGDFYDFVPLPEGQIGIVLGDVCGIGPAAANAAAEARYTLRTFLSQTSDPGRLFEAMNEHVFRQINPDRFVRLLFGALDPERARLDYVNAGHVPPILYRARSGEIEWLGEGGIAMGVERSAGYKVGHIDLDPGDMLVLYTDGVTEAPRSGRPFGQGKFGDLVEQYGIGTPGEMVQAIRRSVDSWIGDGDMRDDIALLVSQVVPDISIAQPERELVLPNEPARLSEIRAFVTAFLSDVRVAVDDAQDVSLAVAEAAGNSVRHGRREEGGEIRIGCRFDGESVTVTIADDGPGFEQVEVEEGPPDRYASGGRGLYLMRQLVDSVEIDSSTEGTVVVLHKRVSEAAENLATLGGR